MKEVVILLEDQEAYEVQSYGFISLLIKLKKRPFKRSFKVFKVNLSIYKDGLGRVMKRGRWVKRR